MAPYGINPSAADILEDEFHDAPGFQEQHSEQWSFQRVLTYLIGLHLPEVPSRQQENQRHRTSRSPAAASSQQSVSILSHWAFWVIVVAAMLLTWDPMQIRKMVALYMDFHPHFCDVGVECCRPVPDIDDWPADPANRLLGTQLFSTIGVPGPETLVWDLQGRGPYTGVADGRVIRWNEENGSWETFAYVSPYWTEELCTNQDSRKYQENLALERICGRPLGIKFHPVSGALFIADAYFGLAMVGSEGGQADLFSNESEGVTHKFTNDLDIHEDGAIYYTVSSLRRTRSECQILLMEGDNSGRLLKYDPETKNTTVLLHNLRYPNGVALSKDGNFLLIASTTNNRVWRYWLQGSKTGTLEDFADQPGYPDNVRSTEDGDFWVAIHSRRTNTHVWLCHHQRIAHFIYPFQQTYETLGRFIAGKPTPMAIKYDKFGVVIDVLEDRLQSSHAQLLSNVQERDGKIWLSSVFTPLISFYVLPKPSHNRSLD
ncbi:unnamed protein product [Calypogeia fissa]